MNDFDINISVQGYCEVKRPLEIVSSKFPDITHLSYTEIKFYDRWNNSFLPSIFKAKTKEKIVENAALRLIQYILEDISDIDGLINNGIQNIKILDEDTYTGEVLLDGTTTESGLKTECKFFTPSDETFKLSESLN